MCNDLFNEDFETVLQDSLDVLKSKKDMKKEITKIVEKCANKIL
jgi:hypothetical protein